MSEHVHSLDVYCDEWGVARIHCATCGNCDELWTDFQARQEQQLAQARALLERYHALRFTAQHRTPDADVPDLWQLQQETRAFFAEMDRKETSDGE